MAFPAFVIKKETIFASVLFGEKSQIGNNLLGLRVKKFLLVIRD